MPVAGFEKIKRAEANSKDPAVAVASLAEQLSQDETAGVIFFCSAEYYDPKALAAEFNARFDCPVAGCTTAGEIGTCYQENSIVALSFAGSDFRLHPHLISPIRDFDAKAAFAQADAMRKQLEFSNDFDSGKMFAMGLFDGLSLMEETVIPHITAALNGVSLVGGSAADNMIFKETRVFANGRFHTGAGLVILIETRKDFKIFKHQDFVPSDIDLIITEADPKTRMVSEINGGPAALEYARTLGLDVKDLSFEVFADNPLMLEIGDQWYVRSIMDANPDNSLTFSCAIDSGLVVALGKGGGFVENLEALARELNREFSTIFCTIGFDCLHRRLELHKKGEAADVEAALAQMKFVGFSTYGEQINAVHVNHTLTGVVIGEK